MVASDLEDPDPYLSAPALTGVSRPPSPQVRRAGFSGIELIPAFPTTVKVAIEYTAGVATRKRGISVSIDKGVRIDMDSLQPDGKIGVTDIDHVAGQALGPVRTL